MKLILTLILGAASIAGAVLAESPAQNPEVQALHEAVLKNCAADHEKFCHGLEGRDGHNCMEQNLPKASKSCQDAIANMPQPTPPPVPFAGAAPANAPPPKAVPPGPYAVTVEAAPGLPTHTVYRPSDLSKFGRKKLPIVGWGNGGCINGGRVHEIFLRKIASHGFMVVSIGPVDIGAPDLSGLKPGQPLPPLRPDQQSTAQQLLDGVDWAIEQNGAKGSPYAGKLDTKAIAVMGQSCGGMQAIAVSGDPRIKTSVIWNSGVLTRPPAGAAAGMPTPPAGMVMPAKQEDLKAFHAPVAYFIGGPTDIAHAASESDFNLIQGVPVFNANLNVGHGGTFNQPNGGRFGEVGVAWLSWQLKGDKEAAQMFVGPDCGLCTDQVWTVKKKNMK
jgi:hypothetical protein